MTTPDILETVGFERRKVGPGDKELGYVVKKSRLSALVAGTLAIVGVLSLVVVLITFEVRFEKRSFHRQLRRQEHKGASKLAHVEMELWSQYRDDIHESHEATAMLKALNSSYERLESQLQETIQVWAKELNLNKDKAASLANKVLQHVADMRKESNKHSKNLMDHLMKAGKKSEALEKLSQYEYEEEIRQEMKKVEEDEEAGDGKVAGQGDNATDTEEKDDTDDDMKGMLVAFWATFDDYEREFSEKTRPKMTEDNPVYKQLKGLHDRIVGENPPSEEQIVEELDKMDLASVDIGLGSGRVLPAEDIVEELVLIPKVPHKELRELQKDWHDGKLQAFEVAAKLVNWRRMDLIPSGWWMHGAEQVEETESEEEEKYLKEHPDARPPP